MGRRLYVGNLPYTTGEAELQELFSKAGTVDRARHARCSNRPGARLCVRRDVDRRRGAEGSERAELVPDGAARSRSTRRVPSPKAASAGAAAASVAIAAAAVAAVDAASPAGSAPSDTIEER